MCVMYISRRFKENICATMHYNSIVSLFGYENVITVDVSLNKLCQEKCIQYFKENYLGRLRQLIEMYPRWISRKTITDICRVINKENVKAVYIDEGFFGQLTKAIKDKFGDTVKVVTFSHDIAKVVYKERLKEIGIRFLPEYLALCKGEKLNTKHSDCVLVLNKRDNDLLMKCYGRSADGYLSMGVAAPDFEDKTPKEFNFIRSQLNERYLLSVGKYYTPNLKGLRWFIDQVFVHLPENYHLVIIGRGMEKFRDEYQDQRIHIIGGVESLASFYNNADVVVAPVFGGGGMKQKTAEAFAYGRPFIGTIESIQGYEDELELMHDGKRIVFASDNSKEQLQMLETYEKNNVYEYSEALHQAYEQKYSMKALMNTLKEHLFISEV